MAQGEGSWVLSGLLGGGVFLFFLLVLSLSPIFSLGASLIGFVAGGLIFGGRRKGVGTVFSGLDSKTVQSTLADGDRKLKELQLLSRNVKERGVRTKVEAISDLVKRIIEDVEQDPADLPKARKFLGYYLDATIKILTRYNDIISRGLEDQNLAGSLKKAEEGLETVRKAFEKQLVQLMENDVMDLDAELQLLERTIKMEGHGDI